MKTKNKKEIQFTAIFSISGLFIGTILEKMITKEISTTGMAIGLFSGMILGAVLDGYLSYKKRLKEIKEEETNK